MLGNEGSFSDFFVTNYNSCLVGITSSGKVISFVDLAFSPLIVVDINGLKSPNTIGRDIFVFIGFDFNDTAMVAPLYSKIGNEAMVAGDEIEEKSEEERIQTINDDCTTTSTSTEGGIACAEKIIMDGWKMNY